MGKEKYDEKKEHSYISYLDANNLYGLAMVQPLPHGNFQWESEPGRDRDTARWASRGVDA
jgi:hypothetical protein